MPGKIRDRIRMIISGGDRGKGRPAKETMLIIFLSGILIFVILLPTGNNAGSYVSRKNQKTERTDAAASMQTGGNEKNETSADEYRRGRRRGRERGRRKRKDPESWRKENQRVRATMRTESTD